MVRNRCYHAPCMFQSTPPHGGRHGDLRPQASTSDGVSIHAPARGATSGTYHQGRGVGGRSFNPRPRTGGDYKAGVEVGGTLAIVSIHAPARGATPFNNRRIHVLKVSIHAPARGATWNGPSRSSPENCFNPRPRTGGDYGVAPKSRR